MYLHKSRRKDGRIYLSIAQSYRDQKRTRTKTISSLGYVDELENKHPDPIAHFTQVVAQMNEKHREETAPVAVLIDPTENLKEGQRRKNLGFAALSHIYHELGLASLFAHISKKTSSRFNLNAIVKLLVYERILDPGSKRRALSGAAGYFENFAFTEADLYRALDEMAGAAERVQRYLHKNVSGLYGRDTDILYYDVTNYYFESDVVDDLRKKGVNKAHTPDPIVQMGLLIDKSGLPMSFDLFAGNTNDCKTYLPIISKVKNNFDVGRVIVVADKGINTSDNCAYNLIKGDGYVFSKSIKKSSEDVKKWCLNASAGRWESGGKGRIVKTRITTRELHIEGLGGKKKAIEVKERHVCVWSGKYARRAARKRAEAIAKAERLIGNPSAYQDVITRGVAKYIEGITVDKNGEILQCKKVLTLDIKRIEEEARYDGFYLIVTSELGRSAQEIVAMYAGLSKIEESFKVTKSRLRARPVYVWTQEHIKAHFLICFISLLIIRILEMKTGHKHSTEVLIDAMKSASATHIESNWWIFDYHSSALDDIGAALQIDFSKKYLRLKDIRTIVGNTKK
jgi:transposase